MSLPTDHAGRALRTASLARFFSWLAAAIGIGFVVLFLAQAGLFRALMPKQEAAPAPVVEPDRITADSSTVTGIDDERQPYEVKAKRGWQDEKMPNLVFLEAPQGKFQRASGGALTISAAAGKYDTENKTLKLKNNVVLAQGSRFAARMDEAQITVREKKLLSNSKVRATFGPGGTVEANGIQISDDGARILFLNGVRARFDATSGKGDTVQ
ncbi:MAG: LPS export ABC transporter periplasmic protein LptC [Aestuariivirga sp.]|uniref:LPS export ABC transporter periplasmic protein LptC n=1 Tax=Aestuariivirga sp. TaxID=2650926 RepID=UPI0038D1AA26